MVPGSDAEVAEAEEMAVREITLEDGRYLVYYSFEVGCGPPSLAPSLADGRAEDADV